jgi:branched-chain amino acid aminotransferase
MPIRGAVYVNGTIARAEDASIPVYDHGFLYGEGVYETLRTYNRVPFLYDRHLRRLRASASYLQLDVPFSDEILATWIGDTMAAAGDMEEAYIRVLLTRGVGELTYDIGATPVPSLVIIVKPLEEPPARVFSDGIRIALVPILRNHPGSVNPIIKSNNLLNNALAMQEALRRGSFEGIMRNHKGELAECTQSNLFIVKQGAALTPPIEAGLLPGITRAYLFEIGAALGIPVREQVLRDVDLFAADECFLTSTTREVLPIVEVDGTTIGAGTPGPVTRALLDGYRQHADALTRTVARKS